MNEFNINIHSDDNLIIECFKKGNKSAFNYLVLKYQKKIYWIIRQMVMNHDEADDITQEVFIKIYESMDSFRGDSKFFTYIYKIAVNFSINHLNKAKRIFTISSDFNMETYKLKSDDKNADEIIDNNQRTKCLEEAIFSLPVQQRAVFNLRYYDNLSYEEIGKILNKSVGGMKANYFHAIKKIEDYLKKQRIFNE